MEDAYKGAQAPVREREGPMEGGMGGKVQSLEKEGRIEGVMGGIKSSEGQKSAIVGSYRGQDRTGWQIFSRSPAYNDGCCACNVRQDEDGGRGRVRRSLANVCALESGQCSRGSVAPPLFLSLSLSLSLTKQTACTNIKCLGSGSQQHFLPCRTAHVK
ncbi:hypothetical protein Mapa_003312 [Marchantia paleacea]|nr:hypothetical protein Mapa_003312 [Marchantia paleacea]